MDLSNEPGAKPLWRRRLGDLLIDAGLITQEVLDQALQQQRTTRKRIGQVLIDMGATNDIGLAHALADQLQIEYISLADLEIPPKVIGLVPADLVNNYLLVPVKTMRRTLVVAMANPLEFYAMDDLRFATQMNIEVAVSPLNEVVTAIERYYPKGNLEKELDNLSGLDYAVEVVPEKDDFEDETEVQDLHGLTERAPVVKFVNAIIADAIASKASDIHIEPQHSHVVIRYRIDGIMREIMKSDRQIHASVVARIKVVSNMDISIRRKPQDGRARVKHGEHTYDLRISSIPTSYGEKLTIRILNPGGSTLRIEDLKLSAGNFKAVEESILRPEGMILVTGPTGSGKSTTLYAILNRLNITAVNIVTVEDPIEFDINGVNQVQINPKAGITFSAGLRSILRQDPDIVMVGEIRDAETASIAFRAGQTGHLVLSTLHTNDSFSTVARLRDMGVEPFILSAGLISVLSQRLVRRICQECAQPDPMTPQIVTRFRSLVGEGKDHVFMHGMGCEACGFTGYTGRLGLHEVLVMTPALKEVLSTGGSLQAMRRVAGGNFVNITKDGFNKAMQGLTTVEEVVRVVPPESVESKAKPEGTVTASAVEKSVAPTSGEASTLAESIPSPVDLEPEEVPADRQWVLSMASPKKIMVVDDSPLTRKLHRHLLEADDYRVSTAANGKDALELIMRDKPDLILCDQKMPEMDGVELVRRLRSQLSTKFIPIIMVTASDSVEDEVKLMEAGADDFLTKPIESRRLLARVKRLINRGSCD